MTPEPEDDDKPFLQRWSRRKLDEDVSEPSEAETPAPSADSEPSAEQAEQHRMELQKNREAAEAIELESLDAESDYAPFFRDGVPKLLKSAALQTLWRSSPVFANLDGLNDYDQNFADPALIKKFTGSAWKVGKGYFREPDPTKAEEAVTADVTADPPEADVPDDLTDQPAEGDADDGVDDETTVPAADQPLQQAGQDLPDDSQHAEDLHHEPEKVRLRTRLGLDDWDAG